MRIDTVILSLTTSCNLGCAYCQNEPAFKSICSNSIDLEFYEKICDSINEYLSLSEKKSITFCYSGGEPLLVGLQYFKNIIEIQKKVFHENNIIKNVIQTNGSLITQEWAEFFKENNISVSVSLDGPEYIQNLQRPLSTGMPSLDKVVNGITILKENNISFGTLTVITKNSLPYAKEILHFISSLGPNMMGYLPCVDRGPKIDAHDYGKFMIDLYDAWMEMNDSTIRIRELTHVVQSLANVPHCVGCQFGGECPHHINIAPDGKVSVCDQYINKEEGYLGDITIQSIYEIVNGELYKNFFNKTKTLSDKCKNCQYVKVCNGGCAYRRTLEGRDYLCSGRYALISHVENKLSIELNKLIKASEKYIDSPKE